MLLKSLLVLYPSVPGGDRREELMRPQWVKDFDMLQREVEEHIMFRSVMIFGYCVWNSSMLTSFMRAQNLAESIYNSSIYTNKVRQGNNLPIFDHMRRESLSGVKACKWIYREKVNYE